MQIVRHAKKKPCKKGCPARASVRNIKQVKNEAFKPMAINAMAVNFLKTGLTLILAGFLLLPHSDHQQATAQRQDTTGAILPDISPREVEIRGQLEISFPSLQRQPLIGFNPPPRVPEIPGTRRPFIEDYKLASADLPNTPLGQPDPPDVSSLSDIQAIQGELEASAGRYLGRILRARLSAPLSRSGSIYGKVDYQGTEGYILEKDFSDLRNPYDGTVAVLGLQNIGSKVGLGIELDGAVDAYTLFGTNILQNGDLSSEIILPDRNGITGGAEFWVRSQSAAAINTQFRLRYSGTRYQTDLFDNTLTALPRLEQDEQRLSGAINVGVPFSIGAFLVSADLSGAGLNDETLFDFSVYSMDIGSGFRIDLGPRFNILLGGRYIGSSFLEGGQEEFRSFLTGDAQLNLYLSSGLYLYAHNTPGIDKNTLWDTFRKNPYTIDMPDRPMLQSTLRPVDAEAGFKFFKGIIQIAARAGYMTSPNYLFFEGDTDPPGTGYSYRRGVFTMNYGDVEILHADGDVSFSLPGGFHAKLGISVRDGQLTDGEQHIPYFSPIISENMVSYSFSEEKMLLQLFTTYHSSRYHNRLSDTKVDDYVDLDLLYSYKLNQGLGLIARIDNIIGSRVEHWQHYAESPLSVSLGMRVLW